MPKGFINGKPSHKYWQELRAKSKQPKRTGIKRKFYPKKNKIPDLPKWYDIKMEENIGRPCEECGEPVVIYIRAGQAHLLPKAIFRSVATHPLNHKLLGAGCGCHRKYDKSWDSAQRMKIWPESKEIIITILIPLLPEKEYKKLPQFLKDEYERRINQAS